MGSSGLSVLPSSQHAQSGVPRRFSPLGQEHGTGEPPASIAQSRRRREEAVQGVIATPRPAARSVAADHPSGRRVTSVHGRRDFRPPIGGRSRLSMNAAGHRRRTRGEAFRLWPVWSLSGHEPPLESRWERAFRQVPAPGGNRASSFAPEPPLCSSVFSMPGGKIRLKRMSRKMSWDAGMESPSGQELRPRSARRCGCERSCGRRPGRRH